MSCVCSREPVLVTVSLLVLHHDFFQSAKKIGVDDKQLHWLPKLVFALVVPTGLPPCVQEGFSFLGWARIGNHLRTSARRMNPLPVVAADSASSKICIQSLKRLDIRSRLYHTSPQDVCGSLCRKFLCGAVLSVQGWKSSPHEAVADVFLIIAAAGCWPMPARSHEPPPCPCWICLRLLLLGGWPLKSVSCRCCVIRTIFKYGVFGFQWLPHTHTRTNDDKQNPQPHPPTRGTPSPPRACSHVVFLDVVVLPCAF